MIYNIHSQLFSFHTQFFTEKKVSLFFKFRLQFLHSLKQILFLMEFEIGWDKVDTKPVVPFNSLQEPQNRKKYIKCIMSSTQDLVWIYNMSFTNSKQELFEIHNRQKSEKLIINKCTCKNYPGSEWYLFSATRWSHNFSRKKQLKFTNCVKLGLCWICN